MLFLEIYLHCTENAINNHAWYTLPPSLQHFMENGDIQGHGEVWHVWIFVVWRVHSAEPGITFERLALTYLLITAYEGSLL